MDVNPPCVHHVRKVKDHLQLLGDVIIGSGGGGYEAVRRIL